MELNWNEMEPELQVLRATTPAQRKIRPHPNPPHNGREQQRVSRLFCSAFSMGKLSLCQGDEPLAAEGVKFEFMRVVRAAAWKYFFRQKNRST